MIPLAVDVPMKRVPWANWILIAGTIVLSLAIPAEQDDIRVVPDVGRQDGNLCNKFSPLVLDPGNFQAHQLVTCLFQHAGPLHLFGNMLFLFMFGNPINAKLGHLPFLRIYFLLGALVSLAWMLVGGGPAIGASGAIMGICGMFFVLYPRNEVTVWDDLLAMARFDSFPLSGWFVVLVYVAFDVWVTIFNRDADVGYAAHIAGFVFGTGGAIGLLLVGWLKTDIGEQTLLDWFAGRGPRERKRRGYRRFPKPHPDQGIRPTDDVRL